ncbi:helix-turn-helix transcriptional regulator [Flavitalea sp.]|nr:AraC family transcriptional regulator [Flavitalea sp.]
MSLYTDHLEIYKRSMLAPDYVIQKIIVAKHFIDNNYQGDISLNEISRASLISKFHFIRLFRKTYGRTPNQYLVEIRITKAKLMLKQGYAVSDVCVAVGFCSITSFTSLYKKITGHTPAYFRRLSSIKKAIPDNNFQI